jgi:hypothetical protein
MDDPIEILQARYAESIGVLPDVPRRIPTAPGEGSSVYVEFVEGSYNFVTTHKGRELQRRSSADVEQVMYWILGHIAFNR